MNEHSVLCFDASFNCSKYSLTTSGISDLCCIVMKIERSLGLRQIHKRDHLLPVTGMLFFFFFPLPTPPFPSPKF